MTMIFPFPLGTFLLLNRKSSSTRTVLTTPSLQGRVSLSTLVSNYVVWVTLHSERPPWSMFFYIVGFSRSSVNLGNGCRSLCFYNVWGTSFLVVHREMASGVHVFATSLITWVHRNRPPFSMLSHYLFSEMALCMLSHNHFFC